MSYVYISLIVNDGRLIKSMVNRDIKHALYDLNMWFFDNIFKYEKVINQLPPIDDWTPFEEGEGYSIFFPNKHWKVSLERLQI